METPGSLLTGYGFDDNVITIGAAMKGEDVFSDAPINIPLRTLNRHGLISGATGTGKTKTLQLIAEQLSEAGVPSMVMDIKGDLSGLAAASEGHKKIDERHEKIGLPFDPKAYPVEMLTISEDKGVRMRATVSEFGPVLFSKILEVNETQSGVISVVFKFCDDRKIPLLDLKDFKKVLQYLLDEGKEEFEEEYGRISSASVSAIMRKIVEIEQQDAELFFGEVSFEVNDLTRKDENGMGYISILRLTDINDKPKLFSTFMLSLLAEVYEKFPEEGDLDKPKLMLFIDEAHLIFSEASKTLLNQIETIVKLIRSKGVGVVFITQNPTDVPDDVLSQLGLKVQHSLRAFSAKDRKEIRLVAQNFPESAIYDVEELLTGMGIGEALVTALSPKGSPTPIAHVMLRAPQSRMDVLSESELEDVIDSSEIAELYNAEVDRESAYEILSEKIEQGEIEEKVVKKKAKTKSKKKEKSMLEKAVNSSVGRQIGRTVARELTRGLLGVLGVNRK